MIILEAYFHYIYFLVIVFRKKTLCQGDCDNALTNSSGKCCANYYMVNGRCQVCPVGYFGSNCAVPCQFPSFGILCQHECTCNPSDCDHKFGCEKDIFEITPNGQPQQIDEQLSEAVTDPGDSDPYRFAGDCVDNRNESGGGCCSNYHMVNGICTACPIGYFGNNCGSPCGFPSFGQYCHLECNCSQSECDHVYGCKRDDPVPERTTVQNSSSTSTVTTHHFTVPIETTQTSTMTYPSIEFNSTTLTLIVGGIVIFFLIVIIVFQVYDKNCKNRERKPPAVRVRRSKYEDIAEPVYCDIDDRYERIEVDSPPTAHKKEDMPLIEVASESRLVPLATLQKGPARSSGAGWEESSEEKSTEPEVSSSNSTSSSGSYLKPVTVENKHKNAEITGSADGNRTVCIDGIEKSEVEINTLLNLDAEHETVVAVHSKNNPYLDVIYN